MFSGDMTDAPPPDGASEMFCLREVSSPLLVLCNYYNYSSERPVEATLIVANDSPKSLSSNYLVDPNKIVAKVPLTISRKQTIVGLVDSSNQQSRYYVSDISIGCGITSTESDVSANARSYLSAKFRSSNLGLANILVGSGATVVNEHPNDEYIDLSPEKIAQSTLLNLLF